MAQYLNLSWVGFYPFVNIFGKQMKTDVYIANPTLILGKITKNDQTSIKRPNNKPITIPKFTRINNLDIKCSQISLQANKKPVNKQKILTKSKVKNHTEHEDNQELLPKICIFLLMSHKVTIEKIDEKNRK